MAPTTVTATNMIFIYLSLETTITENKGAWPLTTVSLQRRTEFDLQSDSSKSPVRDL